MARKKDEVGTREPRATIKMPEPPDLVQRLQAFLGALGYSPDVLRISEVEKVPDGDGSGRGRWNFTLTASGEVGERLMKLLTIKPFDPDKDGNTIELGGREVDVIEVRELNPKRPEPGPKQWSGKERSRRSKPKDDIPDLP